MVLQQNIISKPLNSSLNDYLLDFFSHTNLTSVIEEGAWVAGGFARLVALDEFNIIPNTDHKKILEYIYGFGDIDIFSSSLSQINKAYMRFARGDRYTEAKKVAQNNYFNLNYESCFSNNINFPGKKEFDVNFDISERLREYTNKYSLRSAIYDYIAYFCVDKFGLFIDVPIPFTNISILSILIKLIYK